MPASLPTPPLQMLPVQGCRGIHSPRDCHSDDSYCELADEVGSKKQDFLDGFLPQFLFTSQPRELRRSGLLLPTVPSMFKERMKRIKKSRTCAMLLIRCPYTLSKQTCGASYRSHII